MNRKDLTKKTGEINRFPGNKVIYMKLYTYYLGLFLFFLFPGFLFAQGEFFGGSSDSSSSLEEIQNQDREINTDNNTTETNEVEDDNDSENFFSTNSGSKSSKKSFVEELTSTEKEPKELSENNINATTDELQNTVILADRVKIRVDNIILTERQLSIFFALRKLSSFLSKMNTLEEVQKEMSLILGLEAFAKDHNLYSLLPTRNEMDKRIDFLKQNTQTKTLTQTALKIDPSGNLTATDIRQFFYYQIVREKGFVYALQQEFMNKIFTPRDDEILSLYKQVLLSDPKIFASATQLYIMNIAAVEPAGEKQKELLIKSLEQVRKSIDQEEDMNKKEKIFISAIQKYASSHLKNSNVIGPLDESLIEQDFPEYQELFKLKVGATSKVIVQDGFIRLVFVQKKDNGEVKSVKNPEIRQKIMGIIYDSKGNILFRDFLEENLAKFDLQIMDDNNEQ